MMYLDTHIILWLYEGLRDRLTPKANDYLERHELIISPMVYLEMQYLHEIKRVAPTASTMTDYLIANLGLTICNESFVQIAYAASKMDWTRDPFDRLIVANAKIREALILTKDEMIHQHYRHAIW